MTKKSTLAQAALLALLLVGLPVTAQTNSPARYEQFVIAEDVVIKYIKGEMRFCQRQNLKGLICGQHTKVFGKEVFEVLDWWHAAEFVKTYTGRQTITVTGVTPSTDGSSLTIYYKTE